jgi:hypothetical protein
MINDKRFRSGDIVRDTNEFLEFFDDLATSHDWQKNEYILKHFFMSKDPALRKEIDIPVDPHSIMSENKGGLQSSRSETVKAQHT